FEPGTTVSVHWAPDGSRLALNLINNDNKDGSILLVDLDGPNFHLHKLPLPPGRWNIMVCDWKSLTPGLRLEATASPPDPKTLRGRYEALLREHQEAGRAYGQAVKNAKTPEDRQKAYREKFPRPQSYAGRFLRHAESAPADSSAVDALLWIVQNSFALVGPEF